MKRYIGYSWVLLQCLSCTALASTGLTVIHDSGNTRPIEPYTGKVQVQPALNPSALEWEDLKAKRYPISTALRPGDVEPRKIRMPLVQPVFIVGNGQRSSEWLDRRHRYLARINAVGLLTRAENADDLARIRRRFPGLLIQPIQADSIAGRLDIRHYPVLITSTAIVQ